MKCTSEENKKHYCNCSYSCEKKGRCCDCLHYHRQMGQLPACFFPDDIERSYDRSIKRFIQAYQE